MQVHNRQPGRSMMIVVMMGTVRKGEDKEFWENDNHYNYYNNDSDDMMTIRKMM